MNSSKLLPLVSLLIAGFGLVCASQFLELARMGAISIWVFVGIVLPPLALGALATKLILARQ